MGRITEIAGDIVTAGSAIAGLLLVYIGGLSTSFGGYQPQERRAVLSSYRTRAWFGFVGLLFFLLAVAFALAGKWLEIPCFLMVALMLLFVGLLWVVATAVLSVMEIK